MPFMPTCTEENGCVPTVQAAQGAEHETKFNWWSTLIHPHGGSAGRANKSLFMSL